MLICKNCGGLNQDGTVQCQKCRMAGNLSPVKDDRADQNPAATDEETSVCKNCGKATPASSGKCGHCKFPLLQQRMESNIVQHKPTLRLLKNIG